MEFLLLIVLLSLGPSSHNILLPEKTSAFCSSTKSIIFFFSENSYPNLAKRNASDKHQILEIHFQDGAISSWPTSPGNDLILSGYFHPFGCKVITLLGDTCSVGIWDEKSNCYIGGTGFSYHPTYIVQNFGRAGDYGLVYMKFQNQKIYRQLVIYRSNIGSQYSRTITPGYQKVRHVDEIILDSIYTNGLPTMKINNPDLRRLRKMSDSAEPWIRSLNEYIPLGLPAIRLNWDSLRSIKIE